MDLYGTDRYRVAIATNEGEPDFFRHPCAADHKLAKALRERNVIVEPVVWDSSTADWTRYNAIIIRSTHDYIIKYEQFKDWLDYINEQNIPLYNTPDIVKWNSDKRYLPELKDKGINIIPTVFVARDLEGKHSLVDIMEEQNWKAMAIKPCVSCNAYKTHIVKSKDEAIEFEEQFKMWLSERDMMLQRYVPEIRYDGEWSLIFFDKKFSHAVLKKQATGTYSMCHNVSALHPPTNILNFAEKVLSCIDSELLYARVDLVIHRHKVTLMEIELIECLLFLNHHEGAAEKLAEAIIKRL